MNNNKIFSFLICICLMAFTQCQTHERNNKDRKKISDFQIDSEYINFKNATIPASDSWGKSHDALRNQFVKMIDNFEQNGEISLELRTEANRTILECQKKMEEYKNVVMKFNNSKNPNVRELVEQCLLLYERSKELYANFHLFPSKPYEFISSEEQSLLFEECADAARKQDVHVKNLIRAIDEKESLKKFAVFTTQFKYSEKEIKFCELWKKKRVDKNWHMFTPRKEIRDIHAAGCFLTGNAFLFGKGDEKRANQEYSTAAMLGNTSAMGMIRAGYIEKMNNACLILVYTNLIISFGHDEFYQPYQEIKKKWIENGAEGLIKEIEKISEEKRLKIQKAIHEIDAAFDSNKDVLNLYERYNLMDGDEKLGWDYWEKYL